MKTDFGKWKFLQEKIRTQLQIMGLQFQILKKELKDLGDIQTNKAIQAKLHAIQVEILEHETLFNEVQQLKQPRIFTGQSEYKLPVVDFQCSEQRYAAIA